MKRAIRIAVCVLLTGVVALAQESKPLSNADLVRMVKAGFSDETVIKAIASQPTAFDGSAQALISLKSAGVSEAVIAAMLAGMQKVEPPDERRGNSDNGESHIGGHDPSVPPEVGVYVRADDGSLEEIEPEVVTWRTGGFLKTIATAGFTGGHVNGVVKPSTSKCRLRGTAVLIIHTFEGTSASEYQLLRLDKKKDRREFRAMTGGVIHASGGADKNAIYFDPKKVAPRVYKFILPNLEPGEYGLLAPGAAMSASAASLGKLYTFGIGE